MNSTRYAAILAGVFVVVSGTYIVLSGYLAAGASHSVEELRRLETTKGVLYVTLTALLIFAGARWAMGRMERDSQELSRREQALIVNEGRVFAGMIAASVAHDANNVLTVVLADIDNMEKEKDRDGGEHLRHLNESVRRLIALNQRLLDSAQTYVTRDSTPINVRDVARESLLLLSSHPSVRRCRVSCEGEEDLVISASAALMHQLVGNLVLNAAQATGDGGVIEVRISAAPGAAVIEVHDNGPGVPRERRADLFTSLVTTKPGGNGLGLFSVKACAAGLGGTAEVDDSPLGGALFRVRLPLTVALQG